jgi:radical SAM superfamily enzyme with C-terminal helix-hairpin-helix motif
MESADPAVVRANNLNASPEQVMKAVELLNRVGEKRGDNGMPHFLPGLNFVLGLDNETRQTYGLNLEFLRQILDRKLLLRRINIRQVVGVRRSFRLRHTAEYRRFKIRVRREIDRPMLERLVPAGTLLRDVFLELNLGSATFGRQVGSYPLLIVLPYKKGTGSFTDAIVTAHGERSVTAVEHPLNLNTATVSALCAVPGIGRKRAARLIRARPFANLGDARKTLASSGLEGDLEKVLAYLTV